MPREALALWRGEPLADVADEPFAAAEIRRLEELRLRAAEMAIDADLAAGRHAEVIAELERSSREHPLRERLHAQRMLALYRVGPPGRGAGGLPPGARGAGRARSASSPAPSCAGCTTRSSRRTRARPRPPPPAAAARRPPRRRRAPRLLVVAAALLVAGVTAFGVIRVARAGRPAAASTRTPSA